MNKVVLLCLMVFAFLGAAAQPQEERFVRPVDEAAQDKSFLAFRAKLLAAARRRDAKYVLSIVDKNIKNSFGGDDGIAEFRELWKLESAGSKFWDEFLSVITNGGKFVKEDGMTTKLFIAPYTFRGFPDDLDAFTYSVIFGSDVNLRARPEMNAKVVGRLSYNIVEVTQTVEGDKSTEKDDWYEIKTLGGKRGFVKAEFVRSPIAYRAGFEKRGGQWKMTFFIAGD